MHGRVERGEAVQQRRDALALPPRIDDENHRCAQQTRHLGGRSLRCAGHLVADAPVEQTHDTLDHRDVGAGTAVRVQRADQVLTDEHRIEVAPGPARGHRVVAGVDEIGTHLERRHGVPGGA